MQQEMMEVLMVTNGTLRHPSTYQHSVFYTPDALSATQPTTSKHRKPAC